MLNNEHVGGIDLNAAIMDINMERRQQRFELPIKEIIQDIYQNRL